MNLTLPEWVKRVYPARVYPIASLTYQYLNYDKDLRRINMGYLLEKMINDTKAKIKGDVLFKNKKMYLYSGHESTLGFFLDGLNVLVPAHVPPYASIVLLEVRKNKSDEYFITVSYLFFTLYSIFCKRNI